MAVRFVTTLILALSARPVLAAEGALDQKFYDWKPPTKGDVRSPCPGINTLANHGFINRNGRDVNFLQLVSGAFKALGTSPETSGFVAAVGLASSHNPLSFGFDLSDLRNHYFLIEHDCSFSRGDQKDGNNNDYNPELWDVALSVLKDSDTVTPASLGKAKGERVQDQKRRNPASVYGPRAALFGGIEMGMILSALSTLLGFGHTKLDYLNSVIQEERLPVHLGWRPNLESNNAATAVATGAMALAADPHLLKDALAVLVGTPGDAIGTIFPAGKQIFEVFNSILDGVKGLGHDAPMMRAVTTYLENNNFQVDQGMFWNVSRVALADLPEGVSDMLKNATRSALAEMPPEYSQMLWNATGFTV
ncbi:hypothetical protein QQS21_007580 [Conoideocrella luteorostrata]|uniref:Heme haloperoxidase family profile domain-containing protein n=1 Tax=Conoideocrella luteorostrata TaxID=1105319 RepID=A0AAJ0CKV7_9HYPO|nr:hypothetical protein QQS21_007580 [Conoideocrella luteorostrata]